MCEKQNNKGVIKVEIENRSVGGYCGPLPPANENTVPFKETVWDNPVDLGIKS